MNRVTRFAAPLCAGLSMALSLPAFAEGATDAGVGTRIIGDEEAALGLTITPWQEESPIESDRPPLLLEPSAEKIDPSELKGRVRTQQIISAYRRSHVDPR